MTKDDATFAPGAKDQPSSDDALWQFLTAHVGAPVRIDLSAVTDVTAARLQLLISAQKQRGRDGAPMILAGLTDTFRDGLAQLGVPQDFFHEGSL
jgi:anti-anti-sigma regulatory factor